MPSDCQHSLRSVHDLSPLLCNPEPSEDSVVSGLTAQLQLMQSRPELQLVEQPQQQQQQQQQQLVCELPDSWSTVSSLAAMQHAKSLPTLQHDSSRLCDTMIVAVEPRRSRTLFEGLIGCLRPMWQIVGRRTGVGGGGGYGGAFAQVAAKSAAAAAAAGVAGNAAAVAAAAASAAMPWTMDMLDISELQFLTSGSQGAVFYGIFKGQEVAVKKFTEPPEVGLQDLRHLRELRHPHVVQFIGACVSEPNCNCLIMEFCPFGNLYEFYTNKIDCLPAAKVLDWCKQLASGMAYLHDKKIAHGDLKSPNILVCDGDVLKISDFGLVRVPALEGAACSRQVASRHLQLYGTVRWMSPEQCRQESWGYQADVYSYGVIVWELLFQEAPYKNVDRWAVVLGVGQGTLSLPLPTHTPGTLRTLMESCWSPKPKSRPAFKTIRQSLEMSCNDVLILSDGDLRILRRAWSAEIAVALSSFRQEDSRAKLEADLIRQRREELQHASDIRQHYEKKLRRVDNLQMDLTNLRLRLLLQAKVSQDQLRDRQRQMIDRCCRSCKHLLSALFNDSGFNAAARCRRASLALNQPTLLQSPPPPPAASPASSASPSTADAAVQTLSTTETESGSLVRIVEDKDSLPQLRPRPGRRPNNRHSSGQSQTTANGTVSASSNSSSSACCGGSSGGGGSGSRGGVGNRGGGSPAMLLSTEILTRELQDNMTDSLSDKEAAFDQFKQQGGSRCSAGAAQCGIRDSAATDFNLMTINSDSFEDHNNQSVQVASIAIGEQQQQQQQHLLQQQLHPLRRSEGCANGFRPNSSFM